MTFEEFQRVVQSLSYKPGWHFRVEREMGSTGGLSFGYTGAILFRVHAEVECAVRRDGTRALFQIRTLLYPSELDGFDERRAREWIRHALKAGEEHELDEWLMFGQERPFDPHANEAVAFELSPASVKSEDLLNIL